MKIRFIIQIMFAVVLILISEASASTQLSPPKILVVTSTPDIAWAIREIGGDRVEVQSLLTGREDPHFVDARPDYVAKISKADVVCSVGLELEVGWLPKVLAKAARREIQPGGKGYCEFGSKVETLEKPTSPVNRSQGDVHPAGNPHFWLSPSVFAKATREAVDALERVRPELKGAFDARYSEFLRMMLGLENRLQAKLSQSALTGANARYAEYHREFVYFSKSFGLTGVAVLEEKPGLSPSAARLAMVSTQLKAEKVSLVLAATSAPQKLIRKFEELSGLKVAVVPVSVQSNSDFESYPKLLERIVDVLIEASKQNQKRAQ
jgi:zinc/manganese transport system substrate-binding protein